MGADVLYFTPCCHSEGTTTVKEDAIDGDTLKCSVCDCVFNERELEKEVVDYEEAV